MKKITALPANPRFKKAIPHKRLWTAVSMIVLIAYINMIVGCSYYKVNTLDPLSTESIIEQVQSKGKYLILHSSGSAWHLKDVTLNDANQEMKGTIETLPASHMYYQTAKGEKKSNHYHYKQATKKDRPIFEIHIYSSVSPEMQNSGVTIPFSTINKVEFYDTHGGATFVSVFGTIVGVAVILAVIIVATKSSCPFVYTLDGDSYRFSGELYGGAIYSALERDDYMPLPGFTPVMGSYSLKISNELLERQYTNLANLIVVEHPNNSNVIMDKNGIVQTITKPELPTTAMSNTNINYEDLIESKDSSSYLFNEVRQEDNNISSLVMSFKRPLHSNSCKLIINAKNSYWLDYVYGKFNEQFGTYFNEFSEQQKKVPAKKNIQWTIDQNIPLSVYVETDKGWQFVDYFNSLGPLATRDLVMPINLNHVKGEDVRIKLQCGFMFWEVDYAAIDFSGNIPVQVSRIASTSATDENGVEVSELLAASDDKYLIQPKVGNVVTIKYPAKAPKSGYDQTTFLHSRGYYEYIRDYKNWPNVSYLQSFKNKGAFTAFSKEQYSLLVETKEIFAAALTQHNEK